MNISCTVEDEYSDKVNQYHVRLMCTPSLPPSLSSSLSLSQNISITLDPPGIPLNIPNNDDGKSYPFLNQKDYK